ENGEKVLPAEVETEANVEAVNLPLEPMEVVVVETIKQENEGVEEESTQSLDLTEEATEGLTKEEESKGIVQSVLNMFISAEPSTEVLRNAAILLDSNSCYGCDLQGVNLSGENLDGADLEGANLSNAILKDIDLEGANLKGANLSGVDLSGADLSEADLYKADLSGANLSDANLGKALLDDVNLTGVIGANIPGILLLDVE
ncbi:MAG TPA: pentapeptide repeat-containing protein, partial [Leucothrix sp.]|nr:pentapeptide repeat-containing protein [Leucothrix sp.]